jgi:hypothetical protein
MLSDRSACKSSSGKDETKGGFAMTAQFEVYEDKGGKYR